MSRKSIIWTAIGAIAVIALGVLLWELDLPNWHKLDVAKIGDVQLATRIYDAQGEKAGSLYGSENRVRVAIDALPAYVPEAFIAAEDARFYSHSGIDIRRIAGAVVHDVKTMSLAQGASTITQQLIKLTHLTSEKTLSRKAQEAALAMQLEREMSKDEILEAYLNVVYFGNGAYGIGAAAEQYFGKSAAELTLGEASLLAGVIKSPSGYAPHINLEAALGRREYVLASMVENGYITQIQADAAQAEAIRIIESPAGTSEYAWYIDETLREAVSVMNLTSEQLLSGGYVIYTALDPQMQLAAQGVMEDSSYYPEAAAQGAMIAVDAQTGEVVAIVGGRERTVQRGLNRATQSRRQPGSVIKPLTTYAAAVDRYGYIPTTKVYDVRRTYADGYSPGNAGQTYNGEVTLRTALSRSLNAATVDLADTVGMDIISRYARGFGLRVPQADENLAFALGSMESGVTPSELCAAYGALANGGMVHAPHLIRRILDQYGNVVYEYREEESRALTAASAFIITDMLKTAADTGTAKALAPLPFPVAGKTGTAGLANGDTSDAWTAAYTPEIAVVAWVGLDSNENGGMAASVSGGGYPARMCAAFLAQVSQKLSGRDFVRPPGVQLLLLDRYALENENRIMLASSNTPSEYAVGELFGRETDEMDVSDIWDAPEAVSDLELLSAPGDAPLIGFTSLSGYAEYLLIRKTDGVYDVVAVLSANAGETIQYLDAAAARNGEHVYTVIARHKLLFELGKLVTGAESNAVRYTPGGLLNELTNLFRGQEDGGEIESGERSIFD
ncbi:MAG: transglycosylase domain-containing protein [Christensenellales bacterium]|jgi:1A family penicillin-binding protein